jgi:hypothetical protein
VEEALDKSCWKDAMQKAELKAIRDNNTYSLTELPKGAKAVGLNWLFKAKRDVSGKIVKHKAMLVAKGYAQKQGVDYDEVFPPVMRIEIVRIMLTLAAHGSTPHGCRVSFFEWRSPGAGVCPSATRLC